VSGTETSQYDCIHKCLSIDVYPALSLLNC